METNSGFPAFPNEDGLQNGDQSQVGLTKREYFIAHAPRVPKWFVPDFQEPKKPMFYSYRFGRFSQHRHKDVFISQWNDELDCFQGDTSSIPEELINEISEADKEWEEYYKLYKEYEKRIGIETIIQWRFFYADEILKSLEAK